MRLTKDIVKQVADAAVENSTIPKRKTALKRKETVFAEKVRRRLVPVATVEKIEKARKLIAEVNGEVADLVVGRAFNYRSGIAVKDPLTGRKVLWSFKDDEAHPAPIETTNLLTEAEKIKKEELCRERHEIDHNERRLRQMIESTCTGITTVKKLIELWPEAEKLIPPPSRKQLPSVNVDEINRLMGEI